MRTQDEIVARIRDIKARQRAFEFGPEVLLPHLDFDHAREFLKADAKRESWETPFVVDGVERRYPLTEENARADFRAYAEFAWGKAQDHRGLSAMRSVDKLSAWTWLLGRDDVLEQVEEIDFAMYGCPILKVVCEAFGFPVPDDPETQRMIRGE